MCVPQPYLPFVKYDVRLISTPNNFARLLVRNTNRVAFAISTVSNLNVVYRWQDPGDNVTQGWLVTNATLGQNGGVWTWNDWGPLLWNELWWRNTGGSSNTEVLVGSVPNDVMSAIWNEANERLAQYRSRRGLVDAPPIPSVVN